MQIFVFLLLILAIAANMDTGSSRRTTQITDQAVSIAAQMAWYHNAAVTKCSAPNPTCAPGEVRVETAPGAVSSSATMVYAGAFVSALDATGKLATTLRPDGLNFTKGPMGLSGLVAAELRGLDRNARNVGAWDAATQSIRGSSPPVTIAAGGALPLVDNAPVLVTQVQ